MSVLDIPSAAYRIAFARTTSRCGPEYAAARRSSSRRCSSLKTTAYGDLPAIAHKLRRPGGHSFKHPPNTYEDDHLALIHRGATTVPSGLERRMEE
jgi:hypothetical protein